MGLVPTVRMNKSLVIVEPDVPSPVTRLPVTRVGSLGRLLVLDALGLDEEGMAEVANPSVEEEVGHADWGLDGQWLVQLQHVGMAGVATVLLEGKSV